MKFENIPDTILDRVKEKLESFNYDGIKMTYELVGDKLSVFYFVEESFYSGYYMSQMARYVTQFEYDLIDMIENERCRLALQGR